MRHLFSKYRRSESGNMTIMGVFGIGLVVLGSGVAIDTTRLHKTRMGLQDIADNAALAAVSTSGGNKAAAEAIAKKFISEHVSSLDYDVTLGSTSAIYSSDTIDVRLVADVDMTYGAFVGASSKPVAARSRAIYDRPQEEIFPEVSVAFVLDMSGSMRHNFSGQRRIDTLKSSVTELFAKIESENADDPDLTQKLRTGIYPYSWGIKDWLTHPIADGWDHTVLRVRYMWPDSETIPAQAMEVALQDLRDEPLAADGKERHKVLVYMTDGEVDDQLNMSGLSSTYHDYDGSPFDTMNTSFTERTVEVCRLALEEGIEVIAVGMNAPSDGVSVLVRCSEAGDIDSVASYFDNALNKSDFDTALSQILPPGTLPTSRLLN